MSVKYKESIKIALLGSLGSGKTTLAVSMVEALKHFLSDTLSVSDNTKIDSFAQKNTLAYKELVIRSLLEKRSINPFALQSVARPSFINTYDLKVRIPGTDKDFMIQMTDIPGSILQNGFQTQNILNILQESDTIIITIDTPFLMHKDKVIRELGNNMHDIYNILSSLSSLNNRKVQIVLAPLKCEKWIHDGEQNKVVDAVLQDYSEIIWLLRQFSNVEIMLIPVESIGTIEFLEFRRAYMLFNQTSGSRKLCYPLGTKGNLAVLYDGKVVKVKQDELITDDIPDQFFNSTEINRPVGWYEIKQNIKAEYCPKNCEQILLHSIRFVFGSILDKYEKSRSMYFFPLDLIGNLSSNDGRHVLNLVGRFLKNDVEGIKMIKSVCQN